MWSSINGIEPHCHKNIGTTIKLIIITKTSALKPFQLKLNAEFEQIRKQFKEEKETLEEQI